MLLLLQMGLLICWGEEIANTTQLFCHIYCFVEVFKDKCFIFLNGVFIDKADTYLCCILFLLLFLHEKIVLQCILDT